MLAWYIADSLSMTKESKILKQWIIKLSSLEDFEWEIENNLAIGWEILDGSYKIIEEDGKTFYTQALVWMDQQTDKREIEFERSIYYNKEHYGKKRMNVIITSIKNDYPHESDRTVYEIVKYYRADFQETYREVRSLCDSPKLESVNRIINIPKDVSFSELAEQTNIIQINYNQDGKRHGKYLYNERNNNKTKMDQFGPGDGFIYHPFTLLGNYENGIPTGDWEYSTYQRKSRYGNPLSFNGTPFRVRKGFAKNLDLSNNETAFWFDISKNEASKVFETQGGSFLLFHLDSRNYSPFNNNSSVTRLDEVPSQPYGYLRIRSEYFNENNPSKSRNDGIIRDATLSIANKNNSTKKILAQSSQREFYHNGDSIQIKLNNIFIYYDDGSTKEIIEIDNHSRLKKYEYYYKNGELFIQQIVQWKQQDYDIEHDAHFLTDYTYIMKRFFPNGSINRISERDENAIEKDEIYNYEQKLCYKASYETNNYNQAIEADDNVELEDRHWATKYYDRVGKHDRRRYYRQDGQLMNNNDLILLLLIQDYTDSFSEYENEDDYARLVFRLDEDREMLREYY